MSVTNETAVSEETVVRLLRATKANDNASRGPKRHSAQTAECPPVARFAAVYHFKAGTWTAAEERHVLGCAFCVRVREMFAAAAHEATTEDTITNLSATEQTATGLVPPKPE
ncbi:MAG: hypothetical protein FJ304_11145 [Planctomycetes bacterium]|nr:hypothetical protein [Planctomycetota bacterium]